MFVHKMQNIKSKIDIVQDLKKIQSATIILADSKRASIIAEIKNLIIFDKKIFTNLYLTVLYSVVEHCQLLPDSTNSYYKDLGGLIDYTLQKTLISLTLFKQFLQNDQEYSIDQQLWQYALVTAALLQGLGKLHIDYQIKIYDKHGKFISNWQPLFNKMTDEYYNYVFEKEADIDFRKRLNILMAKLLMPSAGLSWISSNNKIFSVWLALLNEDYYSAGVLGALLMRTNALIMRNCIENLLINKNYSNREGNARRLSAFIGGPDDIIDVKQITGAKFLQWIINALENKEITINESLLVVLPAGLLLSSEIFKLFIKKNPGFKSWIAVQSGFLSLELPGITTEKENIIINKDNYAIILPNELLDEDLLTNTNLAQDGSWQKNTAIINANLLSKK